MRLWSIHPSYLDSKGLVALWREALLAQKVLSKKTKGYTHHPQLIRFQRHHAPLAALRTYLMAIYDEALRRGYFFDRGKIGRHRSASSIPVTDGQLKYELTHLRRKLWKRHRIKFFELKKLKTPKPHPLFRIVPGGVENWER